MPNATIATKILRGRSQTRPRLRMYRLRIETRGKPEQRMEVDQPVLRVGSREENDLVLEDDAVSRIHFEILVDESGHRLRDLGSTNGTFVDGFRAGDIYLKPSCTITAGVTTIHFELLDAEADLPLSEGERFGPLVGRSPAMRNLFATLERVAATDSTVLIQGESGTGKELIAEAIHGASGARAQGPFVVFDCGAIAGTLLESELFGHEKGAFTGALSDRAGCLEEADGGTLFLDEIGELPIELQPKLLRAVERRELRRVGSNRTQKFDVRIIAATNRDLSAEVNRGSFRADLYYRLAVVRLEVPPLRARPEDIPVLVEHLLSALLGGNAAKVAAVIESITEDSWRKLGELAWHGNVRELRNFVERRIALGDPALAPDPAPSGARSDAGPKVEAEVSLNRPFIEQRDALIAKFERAYLLGLMDQENRNISRAAAIARIDRMYFKRLLKKHT